MQRFNTLHRFINDWIDANVEGHLNRPGRAKRMKGAAQRIFDRQSAAYNRCGFFDPTLEHGGPRPDRKRRKWLLRNNCSFHLPYSKLYTWYTIDYIS